MVRVIEAKNLVGLDSNGLSELYVRLKLGKQKFRTKVIKKNMNPNWDEQFCFWVDDLKESLIISVKDEDKFINNHLVGRLKLPISLVFEEDIKSLGNAWYILKPKKKKSKNKECGIFSHTLIQQLFYMAWQWHDCFFFPVFEERKNFDSQMLVN